MKKNYYNLDICKYLFSIIIIILHLRPFKDTNIFLDMTFNNVISRICVPFFLFVSGYFISKKGTDYFKKYLKSNIKVYMKWNLIYIPFLLLFAYINREHVIRYIEYYNIFENLYFYIPLGLLVVIFYTGTFYHLWYFPALIMSVYILDKLKKINVNVLLFISLVFLLLGATETYYGLLPSSIRLLLDNYYNIFITSRNFLFFSLFYIFFGYTVGIKGIKINKKPNRLIISVVLLYLEALLLRNTNRLNSNIMIMSIPLIYYLFIYLISVPDIFKFKFKESFRDLSKYYYLLNPAILILLHPIIKYTSINIYISIIITVLVLIITHVVSKIFIKKQI